MAPDRLVTEELLSAEHGDCCIIPAFGSMSSNVRVEARLVLSRPTITALVTQPRPIFLL